MTEPDNLKPVFISYAHKDNESSDPAKRWLDRLKEHLEPLVQQDNITVCSDQYIDLGDDWHGYIQARLNGALAAVLLVSPAFLASKYIRNNELPVLLRNAKEHGVKIIPVILRPCLFEEAKFKYPDPRTGPEEFTLASLQAAGSPTKPLSDLSEGDQDHALLKVAQTVHNLVGNGKRKKPVVPLVSPNFPKRSSIFLQFIQAVSDYFSKGGQAQPILVLWSLWVLATMVGWQIGWDWGAAVGRSISRGMSIRSEVGQLAGLALGRSVGGGILGIMQWLVK